MILLDFAWCCMVLHDFGVLFMSRGTPLGMLGDAGGCWGMLGCGSAGGFSRLRFCTDVTFGLFLLDFDWRPRGRVAREL